MLFQGLGAEEAPQTPTLRAFALQTFCVRLSASSGLRLNSEPLRFRV